MRRLCLVLLIGSLVTLMAVAAHRLVGDSGPTDEPAGAPRAASPAGPPSPAEAPRRNPLVSAAAAGDAERVRQLLAAGASPDPQGPTSRGALHAAAESRSLDVLRVLLEAGANPDAPNRHGFTPLMAAAFAGALPSVVALLEVGAEVNSQHPPHRVTALEQVFAGWLESRGQRRAPLGEDRRRIAEVLFAAGADPNRGGPFGAPVRFLWELRRDEEMVRLFFDHGARLDEAPHVWPLERLSGPVGDLFREGVEAARKRANVPQGGMTRS